MKTSKGTTKLNKLGWVTCVLVILLAGFDPAQSQVVLVQSKPRPSRPAGKPKVKSKTKSPIASTAAQKSPIKPLVAQQSPINPPKVQRTVDLSLAAKTMPAMMSFAVMPPPSLRIETAENPGRLTAWPELLGYEFNVINVNNHGRERERRKERARFYMEGLNGGVNLEMVEIPAGMFLMGSNDAQLAQAETIFARGTSKDNKLEINARLRSEAPQRMVKVTGFFMSKYEVTQAQWRAVASLPKINVELMSDPSQFKGGNRPVEQITWEEAVEFCERLARATGRRYRLPTEAEWEYAARAGTNWAFSFGDTISPELVNYHGKQPYGSVSKDSPREQTVPVGSLGVANAFGLYDMHGNVWEWCLDTWHDTYVGAPSDNSVWDKDGIAGIHVLRGGSWGSSAGECRSGGRRQAAFSLRSNSIGFRVIAEPEVIVASK